MLGFRSRSDSRRDGSNADVAKVFFDAFSKKVAGVEESLKVLSKEVNSLKASSDRSGISDLVLLERLQKAELTLKESLGWIKSVADMVTAMSPRDEQVTRPASPIGLTEVSGTTHVLSASVQRVQSIPSELGGLPSITTPTELQVLTILGEEGPKSAPEIGRLVGRSREHSARLMKRLYEEGYVRREETRIPFRYSLVERVRAALAKAGGKGEAREETAAPPA